MAPSRIGRAQGRCAGIPSRARDLRPAGRYCHDPAPGEGARHRRGRHHRGRLAHDADVRCRGCERHLRRHRAAEADAAARAAREAGTRAAAATLRAADACAGTARGARSRARATTLGLSQLGHRPAPASRRGRRGLRLLSLLRAAPAGRGRDRATVREAADPGAAEEVRPRHGGGLSRHQAHARGHAGQGPRRAEGGQHGCGLPGVPARRRSRQPGRPARARRLLRSPDPARPWWLFPEGARAADWYERAALAGLAEAQRKLGLLLAKGGAGLNADPAKAKTWLQQAAAQNDADAKKALDAMPK